jgi:uncharacterized protein
MTSNIAEALELRVTRLIQAPRERVFSAWTTPADVEKWFGPETCRVLSAQIDLREGGEFHFRLKSESFGELELSGVYREVEPGRKLVHTWNWSGNPKLEFGESLVTVEFLDRNGFTEVQITHDHLPSEEVTEDHRHGWNGCLDKLEPYLSGSSEKQVVRTGVGQFVWNELLTSDEAGARRFYSRIFGWETADFPGSGMKYTLWKKNGKDVGGLMTRPDEHIPPHWLGYVAVNDVDAAVEQAGALGGNVLMPPFDVPTVGRIAVLKDPQGAALGIFKPLSKAKACSANQVVWFDLPVKDLDRAVRFYSAVLGAQVTKQEAHGMSFAVLPHQENGVSGCLTPGGCGANENKPSEYGPLLYFNCEGRLDQAIAGVEPNGGKVQQPKHPIGPYGFRAVVLDSEGNRIALHSM